MGEPSQPAAEALGHDAIHLWHIAATEKLAAMLHEFLLPNEVRHSLRLRLESSRQEFMVARGALRVLLGNALGCAPQNVSITFEETGKPSVDGLHFNVAHSHGQVLIALCPSTDVGVDIEWVDPKMDVLEVAAAHFASPEVATIANAGTDTRRAAEFYRCWTLKEALLKAHGAGLTLPLESFSVATLTAGEATVTVGERLLYVRSLDVLPGFAAALAVGAHGLPVVAHDFATFPYDAQFSCNLQAIGNACAA